MSESGDTLSEDREPSSTARLVVVMRHQFWPAVLSVPLLTLATGVVFPLALAVPARWLFPFQADGSLIFGDGKVIGAKLIGQDFTGPGYFQARPSAAGRGYDATASGGSNLGPSNAQLLGDTRRLAEEYRRRHELPADTDVPIDAVTRSGSGLDPHISPANAALQVPRIARIRGVSEGTVRHLVSEHTEGRQFGFLGEPQVSVLALNLDLDRIAPLDFARAVR